MLSAAQRDLAYYDFLEFMKLMRLPDEKTGTPKELKVGPHHRSMLKALQSSERCILLLPRFSGKTTLAAILYPLWVLGNNKNRTFLIISHTDQYAQGHLREVTRVMEADPTYIEIFGNLEPESGKKAKWTDNEMIVKGAGRYKDPSYAVMGWGSRLIGRHPDWIILDDIIDRRVAESKVLLDAVKDWFNKEVVPCLMKGHGRLIVIGTPWSWDDLYAVLLESPIYEKVKIPIVNEKDESYWPEVWTPEVIEAQKQEFLSQPNGLFAWMSQFMLDPSLEEGREFKKEWLKDRKYEMLPDLTEFRRTVQANDLAVSMRDVRGGSKFASVTWALHRNGDLYLRDAYKDNLSGPEQLDAMKARYIMHRPQSIIVEKAGQQWFVAQFAKSDPEYQQLPIVPMQQDRDKGRRIKGIFAYFAAKRVWIHKDHTEFEEECLRFRSSRPVDCDLLDATEMAFRALFEEQEERPSFLPVTVSKPYKFRP